MGKRQRKKEREEEKRLNGFADVLATPPIGYPSLSSRPGHPSTQVHMTSSPWQNRQLYAKPQPGQNLSYSMVVNAARGLQGLPPMVEEEIPREKKAGEILGVRGWCVDGDKLVSLGAGNQPWQKGRNDARCVIMEEGRTALGIDMAAHKDGCPLVDCTCGFYAFKPQHGLAEQGIDVPSVLGLVAELNPLPFSGFSLGDKDEGKFKTPQGVFIANSFTMSTLRWLDRPVISSFAYPFNIAFGTVYLWGKVFEHEDGYRAEHAQVRSLMLPMGTPPKVAKGLADAYDCYATVLTEEDLKPYWFPLAQEPLWVDANTFWKR